MIANPVTGGRQHDPGNFGQATKTLFSPGTGACEKLLGLNWHSSQSFQEGGLDFRSESFRLSRADSRANNIGALVEQGKEHVLEP